MSTKMFLPKIWLVLTLVVLAGVGSGFAQAVSDRYFNLTLSITDHLEPFPSTYVNGIRLWCTGTDWSLMNPSPGVYNFSHLDIWLQEAKQHNLDVLYTFARVPDWASSNPKLYCNGRVPAGECAPPDDLNADGTGPDQHWKDFVTALVTHSVNSNNAHINHWEIWNEPNTNGNWQGTTAQMVRMTADATAIIKTLAPSTTINSPAPSGEYGVLQGLSSLAKWMKDFLTAGGGKYLDVVDFHSYVWANGKIPIAEEVVPLIENLRSVLKDYGLSKLPVWSSEGSYGQRRDGEGGIGDPDRQAAFAARYLLLQRSEGLARFYWFIWDATAKPNGNGTLWTPQQVKGCTTQNNGGGFLCEPGVAYEQVSDWMRGSSFTHRCAQQANSQIWWCDFSRPNGYHAKAIWDPSKDCQNGVCGTGPVQVPTQYVQYRDLAGNTHAIQNHTVPVGAKPILLENHSPRASGPWKPCRGNGCGSHSAPEPASPDRDL